MTVSFATAHQAADFGHRLVKIGKVALDGAVRGQEEKRHSGDGLGRGCAHRERVGPSEGPF
jgi:hypothetical protein